MEPTCEQLSPGRLRRWVRGTLLEMGTGMEVCHKLMCAGRELVSEGLVRPVLTAPRPRCSSWRGASA